MPRKPKHGGTRPNAGHPITTGMAETKPVHFRLSEEQRADLDMVAGAYLSTPNLFAKKATLAAVKRGKRRAFPGTREQRAPERRR